MANLPNPVRDRFDYGNRVEALEYAKAGYSETPWKAKQFDSSGVTFQMTGAGEEFKVGDQVESVHPEAKEALGPGVVIRIDSFTSRPIVRWELGHEETEDPRDLKKLSSLRKLADMQTGDIFRMTWDGQESIGMIVGINSRDHTIHMLSTLGVKEVPMDAEAEIILENHQLNIQNHPAFQQAQAGVVKKAALDLFNLNVIKQAVTSLAPAILSAGDAKLALIWGVIKAWLKQQEDLLKKSREDKSPMEEFDYGGHPSEYPYAG